VRLDDADLADFAKMATAAFCVERAIARLHDATNVAPVDRQLIAEGVAQLHTARDLLAAEVDVLKARLGITNAP
jgi:hypothetical protein